MACNTCIDAKLRFMDKTRKEVWRLEFIDKLEHIWDYFGTLNGCCLMCDSRESISCHRIVEEENLRYDVANRYVICEECSNNFNMELYLKKIEEQLIYIEKYKDMSMDYQDFQVLGNLNVAIRRNMYYREAK